MLYKPWRTCFCLWLLFSKCDISVNTGKEKRQNKLNKRTPRVVALKKNDRCIKCCTLSDQSVMFFECLMGVERRSGTTFRLWSLVWKDRWRKFLKRFLFPRKSSCDGNGPKITMREYNGPPKQKSTYAFKSKNQKSVKSPNNVYTFAYLSLRKQCFTPNSTGWNNRTGLLSLIDYGKKLNQ